MGKYQKIFVSLSKELDETDAEILVRYILGALEDVGMEHNDQCLMYRPHSHSCDCDCGVEELQDKIVRLLQ